MDTQASEFGKSDRFFEPKVVRTQIVPTKRLWLLIAMGAPIVGLGYYVRMPWLFWAYNGLLGLLSLITYFFGPNSENLRFRRRMDAVLSVRSRNRVRVELEYEGDYVLRGSIRDEIPATHSSDDNQTDFKLESGRLATHDYFVVAPERGAETFRGTFLRLDCPYGLLQKQILLDTEQEVRVYPNILALREFQLLNQQGRLMEAGVRKSRIRGTGTEFESLREYTLDDDFRKVDWKATARRQKLIVKEYEVERNQAVILCVDTGRHMMAEINGVRKLDLVLDSVLMLIQSALAAGDNVGLLVYGADVKKFIPAKKGHSQMGILLNAMYDLVAEPVESDPVRAFSYLQARHKRRSLVLNFTSIDDRDRAREVVSSFGTLARNHIAVTANINDPRHRELLREYPSDTDSLFKYASTHYLSEERRQAMMLLRSSGLHHLESEPQDLASDLVNYYLEVKAKGRL
jgi:uncharacterized protein (DUF58 family)